MKDIKTLEEKLVKLAVLLGAVAAAALLIFGKYNIALGLFIGTLVSILNFKLLARDVVKKASQGAKNLFLRITGGYIIRYGIMALALIIAARKGVYYFLGVAIGLFAIRAAIFVNAFLISKWKPARS